jgi:hypothetical protein
MPFTTNLAGMVKAKPFVETIRRTTFSLKYFKVLLENAGHGGPACGKKAMEIFCSTIRLKNFPYIHRTHIHR